MSSFQLTHRSPRHMPRRRGHQPPRFNVVQVLCTPCSTPPLAEVLNMCNTTSELGVEHPSGTHRVQHVQHVFNLQHLPLPGAVEQPQTRFFAAAGALVVISKHPWFISVPLGYSICPLCGRSTSAPVCEPNVVC